MSLTSLQTVVANICKTYGSNLTVTYRNGGAALINFRPQPLAVDDYPDLFIEGMGNSTNSAPMEFVTDGSQTIGEGDFITYDGYKFRIVKVVKQSLTGTVEVLHCIGVRSN